MKYDGSGFYEDYNCPSTGPEGSLNGGFDENKKNVSHILWSS